MVNRHRGEIEAVLGGERRTLCLTLGALAELEHAFGEEDMLALAQRFENGRLSARDAIRIIAAGLRGAGAGASEAEVAAMQAEGGAAGYVDIVVRLLSATFGARGSHAGDTTTVAGGAIAPSAPGGTSAAGPDEQSVPPPVTPHRPVPYHHRQVGTVQPGGNGSAGHGDPSQGLAPGK